MSADTTSSIVRAPRDVAGWAALFDPSTLPVLSSTANALEDLRPAEDSVDAHMLSEAICTDPLMTIKVLAQVAKMRRGRDGSEVETVREALVMLGIPPFFNIFGPQESVVARLAGQPDAIDGFYRVLRRSLRAARFSLAFANHRMDHDAPVLHEAALLHDFAELMLWFRAPALALEIARRQQEEPTLRSAAVQREVLNIELPDLQHALMKAWRLPSLLVQITDDHSTAITAQVRNVQLAIRVARHSALGWDNPALPDDLREIGLMLQLSPEPTQHLLLEIDAE